MSCTDLTACRLEVQHLVGKMRRRSSPAKRCLRPGHGAQHGHHGQVHRALTQQGSKGLLCTAGAVSLLALLGQGVEKSIRTAGSK